MSRKITTIQRSFHSIYNNKHGWHCTGGVHVVVTWCLMNNNNTCCWRTVPWNSWCRPVPVGAAHARSWWTPAPVSSDSRCSLRWTVVLCDVPSIQIPVQHVGSTVVLQMFYKKNYFWLCNIRMENESRRFNLSYNFTVIWTLLPAPVTCLRYWSGRAPGPDDGPWERSHGTYRWWNSSCYSFSAGSVKSAKTDQWLCSLMFTVSHISHTSNLA